MVEVVAFARTLANAGEYRKSTVLFGNVVNELHDDDRLADSGAAKQSDFPALQERLNKVNDLHAGLKHFRGCRLVLKQRRGAVNGMPLLGRDWTQIVHGFANHIHHASQCPTAHGSRDRPTLINRLHATDHTVCGFHGDATHTAFAEMLLHLKDHVNGFGNGESVAYHTKGLVNRRHRRGIELDVHGGTGDLNNVSDVFHNEESSKLLAFSYCTRKETCLFFTFSFESNYRLQFLLWPTPSDNRSHSAPINAPRG